jgi:hypothetical protein
MQCPTVSEKPTPTRIAARRLLITKCELTELLGDMTPLTGRQLPFKTFSLTRLTKSTMSYVPRPDSFQSRLLGRGRWRESPDLDVRCREAYTDVVRQTGLSGRGELTVVQQPVVRSLSD